MFWPFKRKKKTPPCKHEWHFLIDEYIYINQGNCIDVEDGCRILCVKCETEIIVYAHVWERIDRRQQLLKKHANKEGIIYG